MTRVYIFNNASRAAGYGIGTYVRQMVETVASADGYEVSLIEIWADVDDFEIRKEEGGICRYMIPLLKSGSEDEAYLRSVYYFLIRHMDIEKDDRIVFHFNYYQHLTLALMLKEYYPDCRIILTVHYFMWCFDLKGNLTKFRRSMDESQALTRKWGDDSGSTYAAIGMTYALEQQFLNLADEVIALSRWAVTVLEKDYKVLPSKINLIYNGISDYAISSTERLAPAANSRNVVFVGRLDRIKGLDYLIAAFAEVADRYPDVRLLIAGDGDFRPYMESARKIRGRVSFLGKMGLEDIESLYRTAYVGVMPSFHEQCSYTAIEMMRHGVPMIATDSTGLGEMLDDIPELRINIDEETFDEEAFTRQIASRLDLLLGDTVMRERMGERARAIYLDRYTAGRMAERYMDVVSRSLRRTDYLSPDYLIHLDRHMKYLINSRPDIDTDFFGMGGIGVYLWWRSLQLKDRDVDKVRTASIMEYLIYYIDWLEETACGGVLPDEVIAMLCDMERHGFYTPAVRRIISSNKNPDESCVLPESDIIIKNALKICNCKI